MNQGKKANDKPAAQKVTPEKARKSDLNSSPQELKQRGQMPRHDEEIGGA